MPWVTVLIAFVLSLAALLYVILPLLRSQGEVWIDEENDHLVELISRKDAALAAIKELEFDYHVGKISDDDFERFDQRLRRQAIGYMQQIEKLAPQTADLDEELEAEIARHRRMSNGRANGKASAPSPKVGAEPVGVRQFCTECGRPLAPGNKFCGQCGAPVAITAVASPVSAGLLD